MSFGEKLKKVRAEWCMTQEDLAKLLNVSRATIAGYESKNKQPDYDKLLKIADIFSISADYLLDRNITSDINKRMEYLTRDEHPILSSYRLLSDENKIRISERIEMLLSNQIKNS